MIFRVDSVFVRYQIAVGTSPGGGQIQSFIPIPLDSKHYTVGGLNLNGQRQVEFFKSNFYLGMKTTSVPFHILLNILLEFNYEL